MREQADLFLGRESRGRVAAQIPRRGGEWLAGAAQAGGAQPRGDGQPLRRRRGRGALRGPAGVPRNRPGGPAGAGRPPVRPPHHLPVHRRDPDRGGRAHPRRGGHPRPAGRPGRKRPAVGHHRGAEGGGAERAAGGGHRRGDRARAAPAARRDRAAGLDRRLRGRGAGRGAPLLHGRLLPARQRLLRRLGCDQPGAGRLPPVAGNRGPRPGRDGKGRFGIMNAPGTAVTGGSAFTADEMMTACAARALRDGMTCFVGIGLPSVAANLARATHAPDCVLIYESGTIGARPTVLPLSIGDGELAETAMSVVAVPEIFSYWLQGGRIDVGFLGAAQIDRYGNLNSTVIGTYEEPKVRLPGAGGAQEIAANCPETFVIVRQSPRTFVERL